ncbi:MAG TPA: DUF1573 domain-containing protein, partial [bacterium (Candidatus Stahlbacteria)]|nr:DUF1573 domain-containing protein [Candidatus Stahlbacteria bacterium]
MLKKLRITLLPLLLVIGLIYGAGAHRPDIFIKEQIWDFGVLGWHQKITHNFVIENHGDVTLVIKGVRAFCGCTATLLDKDEIAPGDSSVIEVTFNSGHRRGGVKKFVWIESNDPDEPLIKLVIKGEVIPPSMENPFWAATHGELKHHNPLTPSYNAFVLVEPSSGKSLKTKQLKAIIRSRGGRLCHYFPPYAAFIYLQEGMDGELLREESIKAIYRAEVSPKELKEVIADYGKGEHGKLLSYVAFVWRRNFVEREKRQKEVEEFLKKIRKHPELAPKPPPNDVRIPPDYEKIRKRSKQPGVHPDSEETSLFMVRDVSVSIILPESNGSIDPNQEDWDNEDPWHPGEDRRALVLSEIQAGLDWYIDKEPLADLTFTYHFQVIETSYEPISRSSAHDLCWINETMAQLGYLSQIGSFTKVRAYNNDLRQQDGTD